MGNYLNVANSMILWLSTFPVAVIVIIQAVIFSRRAKKTAPLVGLSEEEANRAFRIGMTAAIGPAMGVFVVMLGLMAVIGGPLAWMRLSIIGAAPTELAASEMAAKAQGIQLSSPNYGILNFANATWVMALNGSTWLLVAGLFTDKLDRITKRISKGDPRKIGILMISAMCGAMAFMFSTELIKVINPETRPYTVAAVAAAIVMAVLEIVTRRNVKLKKMKEYNLGIAMLAGMFVAVIFTRFMEV